MKQFERPAPTDAEMGIMPDIEVEGWDKDGDQGDYRVHFSNAPSCWFNVKEDLEDERITQEQHDQFIADDSYDGLNDYLVTLINWD